jgi:hypothetical protein
MSYLDAIAERIRAELSEDSLPSEGDVGRLLRLYAVLVRAKGEAVTAADVHDGWVAWMSDVNPDHPALLPFAALDPETRLADEPFAEAIRRVAREFVGH